MWLEPLGMQSVKRNFWDNVVNEDCFHKHYSKNMILSFSHSILLHSCIHLYFDTYIVLLI